MRIWKGFVVIAGAVVALAAANGHHSVSGVFDSDRPFEINGVVTEVEWINSTHLSASGGDRCGR